MAEFQIWWFLCLQNKIFMTKCRGNVRSPQKTMKPPTGRFSCRFAQALQTPDVKVDVNNFYISVHVNICCSISSYCPKAEGNMWFASNEHTKCILSMPAIVWRLWTWGSGIMVPLLPDQEVESDLRPSCLCYQWPVQWKAFIGRISTQRHTFWKSLCQTQHLHIGVTF